MGLTTLPGEVVLFAGKANAVVVPSDYGLARAAGSDFLGAVGMADREAIGGHLHVTTIRIAFESHAFNRLRGTVSAPIPAIVGARKYRSGLAVGVEVATDGALLQFVTWSGDKVLAAITRAQTQFGSTERAIVDAVGGALEDLSVRPGAEVANILATIGLDLASELGGGKPLWHEALSLIEWESGAARPTRPPGSRFERDGNV